MFTGWMSDSTQQKKLVSVITVPIPKDWPSYSSVVYARQELVTIHAQISGFITMKTVI